MTKCFLTDKNGVVAIMFGLMFPVIIASMGIGYDLAQAYMARSRLTQALDAAGLAAGGSVGDDAALQARFESYIQANYPEAELGTLQGLHFSQVGNDIYVNGTIRVDTDFMQWFGRDYIDVDARSVIHREMQSIEVALVLDNTGSMDGTKLDKLKEAATSLINILEAAAERTDDPESVKMSIVPYNMTVNVGENYSNASWLDKAGNSTVAKQIFNTTSPVNRINLFTAMGRSWGGCVEMRAAPHDVTESPPTITNSSTLYVPYFAPDEPDSGVSGGPYVNNYKSDGTTSSSWLTRLKNQNKYSGSFSSGTLSIGYQKGPNAGCEIQPLMRLTNDFDALRARIDDMNAIGETVILTGLMWGWHTLSPSAPFYDGVAYNTDKHKKIMILMTDGQNSLASSSNNNQSYYGGLGYIWQGRLGITSGSSSTRRLKMEEKQAQACTNAKAAGITIYSIRLLTSGDATVMEGCATTPEMFYDVTDVDDLNSVFIEIANSIQNLQITE